MSFLFPCILNENLPHLYRPILPFELTPPFEDNVVNAIIRQWAGKQQFQNLRLIPRRISSSLYSNMTWTPTKRTPHTVIIK